MQALDAPRKEAAMRLRRLTTASVFLLLSLSSPARAQHDVGGVINDWGLTVGVGGGVADFTGDAMRDMTGLAGAWDARLVFGTHKYLGIEAGYVGSLQSIESLGLDNNARLVSTGVDAAVRLHLLRGDYQPYAFVGGGWRRYDLANVDTNTSSVTESDDVLEVPFGIGFAYTYEHLAFDVRGSYRPTVYSDLVVPVAEGEESPALDTFQVSARIGWEF
jgi:hypothetical protein